VGQNAQSALISGVPAPPQGEAANFVIANTVPITAIGPTQPFPIYGPFNVSLWSAVNTALTISAGNQTAGQGTVAAATGLVNGMWVRSTLVPPGTTFTIATTTLTFQFSPGFTNANLVVGTDNNALYGPTAWAGTKAVVERSFDGGLTWLAAGLPSGSGASAIYEGANQATLNPLFTAGIVAPVSLNLTESERGVLYRLNFITYAAGNMYYRISGTGPAAMAWSPGRV